jgi:hypothetical protein
LYPQSNNIYVISKEREMSSLGAIDRSGFRFEPEYSVINQTGAIHVSRDGQFIDEIKFQFSGDFPEFSQIEKIVDEYCENHQI